MNMNERLDAIERHLQALDPKLWGATDTPATSGQVKDLERRVEELTARLETVTAQTGRPSGDMLYPMDHSRVGVSEYGRVGRVEAGRAAVTRRKGGGLTRIAFKQRFDRVPHIQITPERFGGPGTGKFENFWLYLYNDGRPCADQEGFNIGNYTGVGHTVVFRWLAVEIV